MFSRIFLAKTQQEMEECSSTKTAYLSCHFSPYGKGLSNLPAALPRESLLLVDDSMPPNGHDVQLVARQLKEIVSRFSVKAVLLDFQNEQTAQTEQMAQGIVQALACPVAVSERFARALQCPVFLSPPPVNMTLQTYLKPWSGQKIFLEVAPIHTQITVTPEGSSSRSLQRIDTPLPLADQRLHCHYSISLSAEKAIFTLMRTGEDLSALAKEALESGVCGVIGLYQELKPL